MLYSKVKGMNDRLPSETKKWVALENRLRSIFRTYNYSEIRTPIMEYSGVYHRESEGSDMVLKETYDFKDKGGREVTLRPEGTAGIVRSYIENKLYVEPEPTKLFYMGPFYRYERPQKGRYREFNQFGVEVFAKNNPLVDAEVITLAYDIITNLGLKDVTVNINSLGDIVSRENFKAALIDHFTPYKEELCADCKRRLETNPLRILDCKIDGDKDFVIDSPKSMDFLSLESLERFEKLKKCLETSGIRYNIQKTLVRGLDYYGDTVFEVVANVDGFGPGNTLGGGGCYQNLVSELGGPDMVGVGFGFGMERILYALDSQGIKLYDEKALDCFLMMLGDDAVLKGVKILHELRNNNLSADMAYNSSSFKAQLREGLKDEAKYLVILGSEEIEKGVVAIKDTKTMTQEIVNEKNLIKYLKEHI